MGWAAELWSETSAPLHMDGSRMPCFSFPSPRRRSWWGVTQTGNSVGQESSARPAAGHSTRTGTGELVSAPIAGFNHRLNSRLGAQLSSRLTSQVRPEFAAVFSARLVAGLRVALSSPLTAALNQTVYARLAATLSQALAEELTGALSP